MCGGYVVIFKRIETSYVDGLLFFVFKVDIGSNVLVDQYLLRQLELTESAPGPFSRGLLCIVFTKEERAGKSLFGKKSNSHKNDPVKPGLDPVRVQAVIGKCATFR